MKEPDQFPKVSIIMPTYNRAGYILETIQSIRNQTYTNWELIIIDDGSEDETETIMKDIKDKKIFFYKAGRIGIGGKIKNIGLRFSTGKLISFIDSDDLWSPDKLEKQLNLLKQFPGAGFCLTGGYNFKIKNEPFEYFYKQKEGVNYGHHLLSFFRSELPGFTQALLLHKECLAQTGNFNEVNDFSDVDFIVSLAYHFKGVILYEALVYRRLHNKSHSNLTWSKGYYRGIELIKAYEGKLPAPIFRKALFRSYINFGESYLTRNEKTKAINQFLKAWRYRPFNIVPLKKILKAILYFSVKK